MKSLLKAEFIQLTTTRTAMIWAIVVVLLKVAPTAVAIFWLSPTISFSQIIAQHGLEYLVLIFTLVSVTGNYRHKVAVTEQLISPNIWETTLSKLVVFGALGAFVVIFEVLITSGLMLINPNSTLLLEMSDLTKFGLAILCGAFSAMLGVAIARLMRVQIAALLGALAYFVVLERILISYAFGLSPSLHERLVSLLPGTALNGLMGTGHLASSTAILTIVAWIALLSTFAYLLDRKRDWR